MIISRLVVRIKNTVPTKKPTKSIGRLEHNVTDVASEYEALAQSDEEVGVLLLRNGRYRHAAYFFVQAMEKYVRHRIFWFVNPNTMWFIEQARTHDLEKLIDLLVNIVSNNISMKDRVKEQIYLHVLGGVRFAKLHNDLRYPTYSKKYDSYSMLRVTIEDAEFTYQKLQQLKTYLKDIHMLI